MSSSGGLQKSTYYNTVFSVNHTEFKSKKKFSKIEPSYPGLDNGSQIKLKLGEYLHKFKNRMELDDLLFNLSGGYCFFLD